MLSLVSLLFFVFFSLVLFTVLKCCGVFVRQHLIEWIPTYITHFPTYKFMCLEKKKTDWNDFFKKTKSLLSEKNLGWWRRYKVEFSSLLYVGSCWCAKEKKRISSWYSLPKKTKYGTLKMRSHIFKILKLLFKIKFFLYF
jgi:hypothetical protein